jgi:hypothetical protein
VCGGGTPSAPVIGYVLFFILKPRMNTRDMYPYMIVQMYKPNTYLNFDGAANISVRHIRLTGAAKLVTEIMVIRKVDILFPSNS